MGSYALVPVQDHADFGAGHGRRPASQLVDPLHRGPRRRHPRWIRTRHRLGPHPRRPDELGLPFAPAQGWNLALRRCSGRCPVCWKPAAGASRARCCSGYWSLSKSPCSCIWGLSGYGLRRETGLPSWLIRTAGGTGRQARRAVAAALPTCAVFQSVSGASRPSGPTWLFCRGERRTTGPARASEELPLSACRSVADQPAALVLPVASVRSHVA